MTFYTNRNYIKLMLGRIAVPMVIFLCFFGAIMALQGIRMGQFTASDRNHNRLGCFYSFGAILLVTFLNKFTIFALSISFLGDFIFSCFTILTISFIVCQFAFFCLLIFIAISQMTYFASFLVAIVVSGHFVKFIDRFGLFASSAGFGYDLVRHCFSPNQKSLCLGPVAAHTAVGSLYCISHFRQVNNKTEDILAIVK